MHPVNKEGAGVAAPFIDWMHLPPPLESATVFMQKADSSMFCMFGTCNI